jgi:hypothetical protein
MCLDYGSVIIPYKEYILRSLTAVLVIGLVVVGIMLDLRTHEPRSMLEPAGHFMYKLRFCSIKPTVKNPR